MIFVCVENACRSQMAEGFARHYVGDRLNIASGGTRPAEYVDERAIEVMRERGIEISGQHPKAITPEEIEKFDYVITMGCAVEDVCPADFTGRARDWGIEDPKGKPLETYRRIRDEIEQRVKKLIEEVTKEREARY